MWCLCGNVRRTHYWKTVSSQQGLGKRTWDDDGDDDDDDDDGMLLVALHEDCIDFE